MGLESSSLALWKLFGLCGGYLGLLLFTVYLSSSEVRLPIVQYSKVPPTVSAVVFLLSLISTTCSLQLNKPTAVPDMLQLPSEESCMAQPVMGPPCIISSC